MRTFDWHSESQAAVLCANAPLDRKTDRATQLHAAPSIRVTGAWLRPRRLMSILGSVGLVAGLLAPSAGSALADSAPPRALTVMTRNMDEGTDFGYIAQATPATLGQAAAATYLEVLASDVCGRAGRIADEIAAAQPDLVSLQEVSRWTGPVPSLCAGTMTTTIDAQTALMAQLATDGARYVVVKGQDELSSAGIPGLGSLSFLDRDLLLARVEPAGQLALANATSANFANIVSLPLAPGLTLPIKRGWISVDATTRGSTVRVIATHLEGSFQPVQLAQAQELIAGPANTRLPVILAGDLNTGPGSAFVSTYDWLTSPVGGRLLDTWSVTQAGEPGFTDAYYTEDPLTASTPTERIDLVLVRGHLAPTADELVRISLPHPSDHAGVVATIGIPSS